MRYGRPEGPCRVGSGSPSRTTPSSGPTPRSTLARPLASWPAVRAPSSSAPSTRRAWLDGSPGALVPGVLHAGSGLEAALGHAVAGVDESALEILGMVAPGRLQRELDFCFSDGRPARERAIVLDVHDVGARLRDER